MANRADWITAICDGASGVRHARTGERSNRRLKWPKVLREVRVQELTGTTGTSRATPKSQFVRVSPQELNLAFIWRRTPTERGSRGRRNPAYGLGLRLKRAMGFEPTTLSLGSTCRDWTAAVRRRQTA